MADSQNLTFVIEKDTKLFNIVLAIRTVRTNSPRIKDSVRQLFRLLRFAVIARGLS